MLHILFSQPLRLTRLLTEGQVELVVAVHILASERAFINDWEAVDPFG